MDLETTPKEFEFDRKKTRRLIGRSVFENKKLSLKVFVSKVFFFFCFFENSLKHIKLFIGLP